MSWEPINLAFIEDRPSVRPTLGGLGLLYPGRRHVFSGPPESGKTIVAYIELLSVVRSGGRAILIDLEMGPWDARDRLRDLGATDTDLDLISYVEPTTSATPEIIAALVALAPALVVIDAAAGCYELSQLDDNSRRDVEAFARLYVDAFWAVGIATVVVDHVNKAAQQRGAFAIGSERKVGGTDVHLGFAAITAPHRGGTGHLKITVHKDRIGHLPRPPGTLRLDSDADTHAITWTLVPETGSGSTQDGDGDCQPTFLMERVTHYLGQQNEPVSRSTIERNVTGKGTYVRQALDTLVSDGSVTETTGPGKTRLYTLTTPARPLVPSSSHLVPDEPLVPSSPRPPSTERDEDEDGQACQADEEELDRLHTKHHDITTVTGRVTSLRNPTRPSCGQAERTSGNAARVKDIP